MDEFPVSNEVYNILSVLTSKLEALAVYDEYEEDMDDDTQKLLEQIRQDDRRHADLLLKALEKMAKNGELTTQ